MKHRPFALFPLAALLLAAGCSDDSDSALLAKKTGSTCIVQFRRDALGSGSQNPVPPFTDAFNGAQVNVSGTLSHVDSRGIMLTDVQSKEIWIPYHAILLVEFRK